MTDEIPNFPAKPTTVTPTSAGRGRVRATLVLVAGLPARALLGLIWLYQKTLSPTLPVVMGGACGCRFSPTCSHYAAEAVRTHGALLGSLLAARRLVKCTPLHPGGFDPVPATVRLRPSCRRAASTSVSLSHVSSGA